MSSNVEKIVQQAAAEDIPITEAVADVMTATNASAAEAVTGPEQATQAATNASSTDSVGNGTVNANTGAAPVNVNLTPTERLVIKLKKLMKEVDDAEKGIWTLVKATNALSLEASRIMFGVTHATSSIGDSLDRVFVKPYFQLRRDGRHFMDRANALAARADALHAIPAINAIITAGDLGNDVGTTELGYDEIMMVKLKAEMLSDCIACMIPALRRINVTFGIDPSHLVWHRGLIAGDTLMLEGEGDSN